MKKSSPISIVFKLKAHLSAKTLWRLDTKQAHAKLISSCKKLPGCIKPMQEPEPNRKTPLLFSSIMVSQKTGGLLYWLLNLLLITQMQWDGSTTYQHRMESWWSNFYETTSWRHKILYWQIKTCFLNNMQDMVLILKKNYKPHSPLEPTARLDDI